MTFYRSITFIGILSLTSCSLKNESYDSSVIAQNETGELICKTHQVKLESGIGYSLDYRRALVSFDDEYYEYADKYPSAIKPTICKTRTKLCTIKTKYEFCPECEKLMQEALGN